MDLTELLEVVDAPAPAWQRRSFPLDPLLFHTNRMRFRFRAADDPNNSLCEAAIDDFQVAGYEPLMHLTTSGSAAPGTTLDLHLDAPLLPGANYFTGVSLTIQSGIPSPWGTIPLDPGPLFALAPQFPSIFANLSGSLGAQGMGQAHVAIPPVPSLSGFEFHAAAIVIDGTGTVGITGARHVQIP